MKKYIKDYLKLLKFVLPCKGLIVIATICMLVSTIFDGITLSMIVPLADRILANKQIIVPPNLPPIVGHWIDRINSLGQMLLLKYIVIFMVVLFFFKEIFIFVQSYLMNVIGQRVVMDVRNKLYAKFQELSLDFYVKKRVGELISRVTNDVGFIMNALSYGLTDLIYQSMRAFFLGLLSFYLAIIVSWKLFLISLLIFPLIVLPAVRISKKIKKLTSEVQKKMADLNSMLAETIQGAHIVKIFCRENYELGRFKNINYQYYKFILKSTKRMILLTPFTEFVGVLGAMVVLWIIGKEIILGRVSFGIFGLFLASLMSIIHPLKKLTNVHAINQQALSASQRIYEILEEKPKVVELPYAQDIRVFKDKIVFENVWFAYENEDYVLKNINLKVDKGEKIALVGHSGAGKTTLISLLPRLYDPQKGRILFDGLDIREFKLQSLRSIISMVSQEMVLFNTTVRDNIAYGKEGAKEEEIIEAARKANAYDFIKRLPEGFSTIIGDRGFRLSGGEKQRLSIARAILKDAPILILDEATSQLDSVSESAIKDALYKLMEGKTVFVIAHRISTVQRVDRIFVMDKGEIVDEGNHSYLISYNRLYKRLYELQFSV
ncbi:MAG: ABC transporter ATP-binding protein/permease [Candidatus Omnitrophica bacterium]|nr:ABC transporter ATP-binding protein/permease [Candidatus Omnitrophota bacterium]MCM8826357.1 ABC transporter ATP-binding protein/permease [Candidatus Omnitrophota bacterium]